MFFQNSYVRFMTFKLSFLFRSRKISSTFSIESEASSSSFSPAGTSASGDQKYRRMRDLNNIASRRCRQNRKQKFVTLERQEEVEAERNSDLKMKVRLLEEQVKRVKDAIFKSIVPVANPLVQVSNPFVDIDEIIRQKAADLM